MYQLIIAEKPSVVQSIAAVLGAKRQDNGYLEAELRKHDKEFCKLDNERYEILFSSPALYSIFDADEAAPLDKEDAKKLLRVLQLDSQIQEITDRAIFVYSRQDAYRFMRSIGKA